VPIQSTETTIKSVNVIYYLTNLLLLKLIGISKVINRLKKNCITNNKYVRSKQYILPIYCINQGTKQFSDV